MTEHFKKTWNKFWFTPQHPYDLCFARPLFYFLMYFFFSIQGEYTASWLEYAKTASWTPISFFKLLPQHVPDYFTMAFLRKVWEIAALFSAFGLFTRVSTKVAFFVGLYLFSYRFNFGKIDNLTHLPLLVSGILAFSRCGDYFSIDWIIRRIRKEHWEAQRSEVYRWPLMLVRSYILLIYFEAGYQKLNKSGLSWATAENFQVMLLTRPTVTDLGIWVSNYPALCQLLVTTALVAEAGAPLALMNPLLAITLVPILFCFHIGTYLLMGDHGYFIPYNIVYVFWIPWLWIFTKLSKRKTSAF